VKRVSYEAPQRAILLLPAPCSLLGPDTIWNLRRIYFMWPLTVRLDFATDWKFWYSGYCCFHSSTRTIDQGNTRAVYKSMALELQRESFKESWGPNRRMWERTAEVLSGRNLKLETAEDHQQTRAECPSTFMLVRQRQKRVGALECKVLKRIFKTRKQI
jgi:hypothetical protein